MSAEVASGLLARKTKQKEAIRAAILLANRPLSPEEILSAAQKDVESLSLATVYRNITALCRDEWLKTVTLPGLPSRYEVAGKDHHHHFHCNACDKVFELKGCSVDLKARLPKGFVATGHDFSLSGTCSACR